MDPLARYAPLVDDYEAFRATCERPLPTVVRVNSIKATPDRVGAAFDDAGLEWAARRWNPRLMEVDTDAPGNTWPDFLGWTHGQEEVSAVPPLVLDPAPDDRVWDACAAPGSKTTQLAALMDDRGLVLATDDSLGRLAPLRSNTERLGVTNAVVDRADARNLSLAPYDVDAFDAALVDAPCSGEGTLRKNPDALAGWSASFLEDVARVQRAILRRAVEVTRPGGTVVYSTCTYAPEENEAVVDAVVGETDCRPVPFEPPIEATPGVVEWQGERFDDRVRHARRFWPHHGDTGGFFCAKLGVGG